MSDADLLPFMQLDTSIGIIKDQVECVNQDLEAYA